MLRVGLTGGIAAGKSTVAGIFRELGWDLVDADEVARKVVSRGEKPLKALVDVFGDGILDASGNLDRPRLGRRVFNDARSRARLEAILHPAIVAESARRFAALAEVGAPVVLYEAALLVETGRHKEMDALIVVVAEESLRIARLCARDGISDQEARRRLQAQGPQDSKAALADHLIDNSKSLADTREQVEEVWRVLGQRLRHEGECET